MNNGYSCRHSSSGSLLDEKLKKSSPGKVGGIIFAVMLVCGLIYIGIKLGNDLSIVHSASVFPFILLGLALFIALGFEFVNGFHDTANAVATCIYTHSLEPHVAVVYSGIMNFIGVLTSSGAVAFSIITLLPVELILKVSKGSGFSMVFALLTAAILWNLATWWKGLPASSSHTMIGSIIGVGIANQLMHGQQRHCRRRLGAGYESLQSPAVFPAYRIRSRRSGLLPLQAGRPRSRASTKRPKAQRHRRSISVLSSSSPAAASASLTAPTTDRKAWASLCSSSSAPSRRPTRSTTQ